jgi:putative DNA methylase
MIEIPPKFAGKPAVNPDSSKQTNMSDDHWFGIQGLTEDVRYYGKWMRDEAKKRIGYLYPKVEITAEMAKGRQDLKPCVGRNIKVIAWLWARTVKSPNPAFAHVDVPLVSTFMLSTKIGKEAYVEPVIENGGYRFTVKIGKPKDVVAVKGGTKLARGANFKCLISGVVINDQYIKAESMAGRMGTRLMAIVAEGDRGRVYLPPTREHEAVARKASPKWKPDQPMNRDTCDLVSGRGYGFFSWADLFTYRQLVALTTFCDLVGEVREIIKRDALVMGFSNSSARLRKEDDPLCDGGIGVQAYADAVSVYLSLAIDKTSDYNSSLVLWSPTRDQVKTTFSRQALPMAWDFAETNVFANAAGDIAVSLDGISRALAQLGSGSTGHASANYSQTRTSLCIRSYQPTHPITIILAMPNYPIFSMYGCVAR